MKAEAIFIIILLVCFAAQTYRLVMAQNESDYEVDLYEDHIDQLTSKIKELEKDMPKGVINPKCDRWNPRHNTVTWYLNQIEAGNESNYSIEEHIHYKQLVEVETMYQVYRGQPLQGYRNNSKIWEAGWCDKWSDGLGNHGLGHDHWGVGRFEYEFNTNVEFAQWLTNRLKYDISLYP